MEFFEVLIPLGFFAAVVLSFYYFFNARNKERMALIEKGLYDKKNKEPKQKKPNNHISLKIGTLLIGLGMGLFFGFVVASYTIVDDVVSYFTMIMLFGGAALILNNFIGSKKQAEEV